MLFGMDKVELKFTQVRMEFRGHSFKFNISEEALAKTDIVNLSRKPWQRFRGWQLTGRQELEGWGGLLRNCCLMSCLRSQVMLMDGDVKIMTIIRSTMTHEGRCEKVLLDDIWKSKLKQLQLIKPTSCRFKCGKCWSDWRGSQGNVWTHLLLCWGWLQTVIEFTQLWYFDM